MTSTALRGRFSMAATKKSTQAGTKKKRAVSNSAKTSKIAFEAQQKAAKALTLRMEGATFETIAKELGYAGKQGGSQDHGRSLLKARLLPVWCRDLRAGDGRRLCGRSVLSSLSELRTFLSIILSTIFSTP